MKKILLTLPFLIPTISTNASPSRALTVGSSSKFNQCAYLFAMRNKQIVIIKGIENPLSTSDITKAEQEAKDIIDELTDLADNRTELKEYISQLIADDSKTDLIDLMLENGALDSRLTSTRELDKSIEAVLKGKSLLSNVRSALKVKEDSVETFKSILTQLKNSLEKVSGKSMGIRKLILKLEKVPGGGHIVRRIKEAYEREIETVKQELNNIRSTMNAMRIDLQQKKQGIEKQNEILDSNTTDLGLAYIKYDTLLNGLQTRIDEIEPINPEGAKNLKLIALKPVAVGSNGAAAGILNLYKFKQTKEPILGSIDSIIDGLVQAEATILPLIITEALNQQAIKAMQEGIIVTQLTKEATKKMMDASVAGLEKTKELAAATQGTSFVDPKDVLSYISRINEIGKAIEQQEIDGAKKLAESTAQLISGLQETSNLLLTDGTTPREEQAIQQLSQEVKGITEELPAVREKLRTSSRRNNN